MNDSGLKGVELSFTDKNDGIGILYKALKETDRGGIINSVICLAALKNCLPDMMSVSEHNKRGKILPFPTDI